MWKGETEKQFSELIQLPITVLSSVFHISIFDEVKKKKAKKVIKEKYFSFKIFEFKNIFFILRT